jgi:segregation and condensation protein B
MVSLVKRTKSAFKALEIVSLPDGSYVFQLKPEYNTVIRKYASKPLLPTATLKTLSYIAYMQPVSSKRLVEVRGTGVYLHLKLLEQLAYIEHQNVGRLKIYNTTEKFQKYFGIQGDKDLLRQKLFTKVRSSNQIPAQQSQPATEPITQSSI